MSEQDKPVAWMAMRFGNSPANVTLSHAEAVGWHASGGDVRALVFAAPPAPPAPELPELPEPWRATVDDMLTVCHMTASDDPRESVNRLINWHVSVALDPCVSSDAQALIDQGAAIAADRAARAEPVVPEPTRGVISAALQQAFLALEELQGPGFLIGGVMHHRIGLILPELYKALELLVADRAARVPVLTDDAICNLWIRRTNIHDGDLVPQLIDFARAVLAAAQGSKP